MKLVKRFFYLLYYIFYTFVYIGWFFHRTEPPLIFQYSAKHLTFLALMLLPFFLPQALHVCRKVVGWRGLFFSLIPCFLLLGIMYSVLSIRYYYLNRVHPFDPFLQHTPVRMEDSYLKKKEKSDFRILFLGGSTTECSILSPKESYPGFVQSLLQERYPSRHIEILNAGRAWYTTKHSLITYVTYYQDWEPDLVIAMHGINDLYRSFSPPTAALGSYNELWSHFYGASINGARSLTFEQHLFRRNGVLIRPFRAWYSTLKGEAEVDYPPDRYQSIHMFEKYWIKLIHAVHSNQSNILLVSEPFLYKSVMSKEELGRLWMGKRLCYTPERFFREHYPSAKSMANAMNAFNEMTRKAALSEHALFVDGAQEVIKDLDHIYDDVHLTAAGARMLAEAVASEIIHSGIISEKTRTA